MKKELFYLINLKPYIAIDKDFNIMDYNENLKRELNLKNINGKCYEVLFKKEKPCFLEKDEECPLVSLNENESDIFLKEINFQRYIFETYKKNDIIVSLLTNVEKLISKFEKNKLKNLEKFLKEISNQFEKYKSIFISFTSIINFEDISKEFGLEVALLVSQKLEKTLINFLGKNKVKVFPISDSDFLILYLNGYDEKDILNLERQAIKLLLNFENDLLNKKLTASTFLLTTKIKQENYKDISSIIESLLYLKQEFILSLEKKASSLIDIAKIEEKLTKKKEKINILKRAIEEQAVEVYFQPIVDLETRQIHHLEALMRIIINDKVYSAGYFINELLENNFIDLDILVLKRLRSLYDKLLGLNLPIFINVSYKSLASYNYRRELKETLEFFKKKNPKFGFHLEITEQVMFNSYKILEAIKDDFPNVKIAIDDFGIGYSSLGLVAKLVEKDLCSYIKIDGSVVKDSIYSKPLTSVIETICTLAEKFKLETIAEYIENEELENYIKKLGVKYGQGYLYSPPRPIDDFLKSKEIMEDL